MIWLKSIFLFGLYRLLWLTWRIRIHEDPSAHRLFQNNAPLVLAHWHGDEYALFHLVNTYSLATMTSTSRDGEVVNYLVKKLGGKTTRGSSTRGAAAGLKGLVRLLRGGQRTSMAVDGPRGPYHVVKPGVFELARLGRAEILPVGVHVKSAIRFHKAWNKAYLPLPFAKVQVFVGPPFPLSKDVIDVRNHDLAQGLGRTLDDANSQAAALFNCDA